MRPDVRTRQLACDCRKGRFREGGEHMPVRTSLDPEYVKSVLKTLPLFDCFVDQELSSLLERTNVYRYRKGEIIFLADESNQQMYVILKGRLKVVEITREGQERVMAFRHRGDYFGDMGLLDGKTDFATIVAMEPCKLLLITKSVFDEFFMKNNKALRKINQVLCGRLRECWVFHTIIGMNDAETKVRATLARYSTTLGVQNSNGIIINSILSHQGIADRVQISRETATRILKKMRQRHEIEITGRRIKLLPAFFQEFSQSKLFLDLAEKTDTH
jgi:CRP/FNR family transcriptional regulator, cyclic AMP receptor protein